MFFIPYLLDGSQSFPDDCVQRGHAALSRAQRPEATPLRSRYSDWVWQYTFVPSNHTTYGSQPISTPSHTKCRLTASFCFMIHNDSSVAAPATVTSATLPRCVRCWKNGARHNSSGLPRRRLLRTPR